MAKHNNNDGDSLFQTETTKQQGPLECLGMTFPNEEERRNYFLEKLREKLKDPEFRKIEGFPIGTDEDILALSDPPYYTACPNPFVADFIKHYGKPYDPSKPYSREPFAADVSEGKNDPIYNAHGYHTKVPHKAIMRYILHYTEPGDIVFDGFCGTGMTGVAAQMCGDKAVVESLGYKVEKDGTISQQEKEENGNTIWKPFSKLGPRLAVLNDLSPAATFIAYNYNTPVDVDAFEREATRILKEINDENGWMYETLHKDGKTNGKINYTVWSDVFVCPECTREVIFWDVAVDRNLGTVRDEFPCTHCKAVLTKRSMQRAWVSNYDKSTKETVRQAKQSPVYINYSVKGIAKGIEKLPDANDLALIDKINRIDIPYWFPIERMIDGQETRRNDPIGITHTHHFYSWRNLAIFAAFNSKCSRWLRWALTGALQRGSKQHQIAISRVGGSKEKEGGATAGHRRGTLYVPSNQVEMNAFNLISDRVQSIKKALLCPRRVTAVSTSSSTINELSPDKGLFDYLFLDPPFGSNIAYSELNFLQESWLRVQTNQKHEAIEDKPQKKQLQDYHILMRKCFQTAYLLLKPGRWMTVEFSNTSAAVWNVIQNALQEAGFIVANVSALDKKRGGLNAIVGKTAVKQDLAISAYKPNGGFEDRFQKEAATEEGVWDFVRTHLKYLPVTKRGSSELKLATVTERDPRILYDQVLSYYLRKGLPVPIDSVPFQEGLAQRFAYRDGLYFLAEQVIEYDKKRLASDGLEQAALFVSDESSAIAWLRQLLKEKPQTFQDIHPQFIRELGGWQKHEKPLELSELLEQNFLPYDGKKPVPEQIHAYLSSNWKELRNLPKDDSTLRAKAKDRWYVPDPNKIGDLEKLREKSLLREFEEYRAYAQKRLKVFRLEAVRAGFKKAWQERDYNTIIAVAGKIPEEVLQEDSKLLMWYDQAMTRKGETA